MPPVVFAAVAGAIAAAGTAWAAGMAVTFAVVATGAAISAGLAGAQMALAPRQKPFRQELTDRGHSVRQPISPRQIVYGRVKTGGPIIFLESTHGGQNQKNKWLQMVIPLAAHEVDAIEDVYFDGEMLPLGPDGAVTGGKYFDASWPIEAQRPRARVWKHLGQPGQVADARLISVSAGKWTAAHVGTGIAYLYVELEYTASIYTNGIPNVTAVVRGRKVHDPRTGQTVWSDNAALCMRDYLMLSHAAGGLGATTDEFDGANIIAAANLCDEAVPLDAGGTEKRYTLNGTVVLSTANTPRNTLESMLTACGGSVIYSGGKWRILPAAYRNPTVTLTDTDLRAGVNIQTRVSHKDVFTGIKGTYSSPANLWQPADYPPVQSDAFVTEIGGEPVWRDVDRPFTTSAATAQRLAKIDILKVRQPITVTLPCKLTAFRVQAGDVVRVTLPRMGWTAKTFEVVEWLFAVGNDGTLGCDLSLRETDPSIYDFLTSEEQAADPAPGTDLPDWNNVGVPRNLSVDSSASQVVEGADGSLISRAVVTWERALDGFVDRYEIHWRLTGETTWPNQQPVDGISSTDTFTYSISNMPVGASIDVRVRAVNGLGVPSNFVTVFGHVISGTTARPNPAITGLKVQGSPADNPGQWTGDSATFVWNEATTLGSLFDAYVVTIRNTGAGGGVRRVAVVRGSSYTYDFAANSTDGLVRSFIVDVQARTKLPTNNLSPAASLTATNPVPALPTAVTLTGEFRTIAMRYTPPAEPDYAGILVWASETSGFAPAAGNLKYQGPDTLVVIPAEPGKTYFVRYASFDLFGTAGVTISGEVSVSTVKIAHADLAREIIDTSNLIPALTSRIDLIDTAGTGLFDRLADLAGDVGALETAVSTETTTRQTADSALGSRIDSVSAVINSRAFYESFDGDVSAFLDGWHNNYGATAITVESGGGVGGKFLRIGDNNGDDGSWRYSKVLIPFDPNRLYKVTFRLRCPVPSGAVWMGVRAVLADGVTNINYLGQANSDGGHFVVREGWTVPADWTVYSGYIKGTAYHSNAWDVSAPSGLHPDARYFSPMLVCNWPPQAGITDVDLIQVEFADADAAAAAVVTEAAARATAINAEASLRETLAARVTGAEGAGSTNAAAISTEATVRATADNALSTRVDTVAARFDGDLANLIDNPVMKADAAHWHFWSGVAGGRVAAGDAGVPAGCPTAFALRIRGRDTITDPRRPAGPGERHFISLMGASDPAAPGAWFGLACYDAAGNFLGVHGGTGLALTAGPTWRKASGYVITPPNTAEAAFYVVSDGAGGSTELPPWHITQVQWRPAGMVDEAFAAISTETTARATAIGAEATARQTLQTTVDGHTAAIETAAQSIDGLEAQYTVKVQADGYVAGYGLAVTANNGAPTSSFVVAADRFAIAQAGTTTLNPTIPFIVTTKGGVPIMSFSGYASIDRLLTGTLDTETLRIGGSNVVLDGPTRQIRVNNGTTDLVKMGQISTGVYGIEIRDSSGALIMSSGAGLAAGVVKPANLALGVGGNLLHNPDWATGNLTGWNFSGHWGWTPGEFDGGINHPDGWRPYPTNAVYIWQASADASRWIDVVSDAVPCVPGERFEASAYVGVHRCNAYVLLSFTDAYGNHIGHGDEMIVAVPNHNQASGGNTLEDFRRCLTFAKAPAGTAGVRLLIRKDGTSPPAANSFMSAALCYLGRAGANQVDASPWSVGTRQPTAATTSGLGTLATKNNINWNSELVNIPAFGNFAYLNGTITSANISTYISSAAIGNAYIAEMEAGKLRAGYIDTFDIFVRYGNIRIWDSNNNRDRVILGHRPGVDYGFWVWAADGSEIITATDINGVKIRDLTVDGNTKLANLSVGGVKIQDLAASNSAGASTGAASNSSSIGVAMDCIGKTVTVFGSASVQKSGTGSTTTQIRLLSNGVDLTGWVHLFGGEGSGSATVQHTFVPPAGARDFYCETRSIFGAASILRTSVWAIENRK